MFQPKKPFAQLEFQFDSCRKISIEIKSSDTKNCKIINRTEKSEVGKVCHWGRDIN